MPPATEAPSHPSPLSAALHRALDAAGGWLPFDRFMALALYAPEGGYYAGSLPKFGAMPGSGSDFVTAPELSPLFGRALAVQVAQALLATGTTDIWEFGAGTGALARQVLDALAADERHDRVRYHIVELSGSLRERQQGTLAGHAGRVVWESAWPDRIEGVVLGNEVLDAMPVQLLHRVRGAWHERGVVADGDAWAWADRPTPLRPPVEPEGPQDYLTEVHPQAEAFVKSLSEHLVRGAAFFIDYGFPESEYYHPQRHMGTLMCHQGHRADGNPLVEVGAKDITAHVNFTGIALAAQDAGQQVLGYASQARFLINCGLVDLAAAASVTERAQAMKLLHEHEMGELFKVLAFAPEASAAGWEPLGFAQGDRVHTL
ncbi:class I SAM-dependent methyltransferase [Hydrogenophaga sp. OTU3427]|uniref:class I SAM-dependent methyltransferase n=1 Tax=Hydrogenophaga sp. OTU3427 TaxID=3043856 RepID=UPI00313CC004